MVRKRFIRQVRSLSDTPSLIQLIAADSDYLMLCREVVNTPLQENNGFFRSVSAVCRKQDLIFHSLRNKLTPVAHVLGLNVSSIVPLDYYHLLGVSPKADVSDIKKAFRKEAYEVHPDTGSQGQNGYQKFVELSTAYRTLIDPVLRKHYDLSRQALKHWHERPVQTPVANRPGKALFVFQLGGLILILMFLILIFDFLYR